MVVCWIEYEAWITEIVAFSTTVIYRYCLITDRDQRLHAWHTYTSIKYIRTVKYSYHCTLRWRKRETGVHRPAENQQGKGQNVSVRSMLPKLFSTATQFLERRSIATHIALLDKKKVVLKRKKYFYLLLNIILQKRKLNLFLIMRRVFGALVSGIIYWGRGRYAI
jgi:hypothetical protein